MRPSASDDWSVRRRPARSGELLITVVLGLGGGLGLPACHRGGGAVCSAPVQEQLDSRSTQHLFPGAAEPRYQTDPPTSGPHRLGAAPTGVSPEPIDRPLQVHMLESGTVLIQHRDLPHAQLAALEKLAG